MGSLMGIAALVALLLWLMAPARKARIVEPEDDVSTPIDRDELEAAERELAEDADPDDVDEPERNDWGPGRG